MRHRRILRDSMLRITNPSIKRMSLAAGVLMLNYNVYDYIKTIIKVKLDILIKYAIIYAEYAKRITISYEDIKNSYKNISGKEYDDAPIENMCKIYKFDTRNLSIDESTNKQIKFYKNEVIEGCLFFPKATFYRLIREVAQDQSELNIKFSKDALLAIQSIIELYILKLFKRALYFTNSSKRSKMSFKDIDSAYRICSDPSLMLYYTS